MNRATGLTHPGDKTLAVWAFRHLVAGGHALDPDEIRACLLTEEGWTPRGADQAKEVAEGVLQGKRFKVGPNPFKPNILDIWRSETRRVDENHAEPDPQGHS